MAVLRQPARLLLAVIAGLAIAVVIDIGRMGGPYAWLAHHRLLAVGTIAGQGERVDIGGRALYLDCRGSGSPTIVLEAGMGDGVAGWLPVIDGMAATTRTCAYDRAGRGGSDARSRHTVADATDDLRVLLATAGERPPYVLVGHSLGEVHARVFADRHRADVAGLVLVDGFSVDLEADWIHPLLGGLRPEYEGQADDFRDLIAGVEGLDCPSSCSERHGSSHVLTSAPTRRSPTHGRQPMRRSRRGTSGTRSPGVPAISCRPIAPTS
jgi:pimeloyl-ACP methyl ester carboxylesterase